MKHIFLRPLDRWWINISTWHDMSVILSPSRAKVSRANWWGRARVPPVWWAPIIGATLSGRTWGRDAPLLWARPQGEARGSSSRARTARRVRTEAAPFSGKPSISILTLHPVKVRLTHTLIHFLTLFFQRLHGIIYRNSVRIVDIFLKKHIPARTA